MAVAVPTPTATSHQPPATSHPMTANTTVTARLAALRPRAAESNRKPPGEQSGSRGTATEETANREPGRQT